MAKEKIEGSADEATKELEPIPQATEDHTQALQLTNLENVVNDIKDTLEQREKLARQALVTEVEVDEPEPERKSSLLRWVVGLGVGLGIGALVLRSKSTESTPVSQPVEDEA